MRSMEANPTIPPCPNLITDTYTVLNGEGVWVRVLVALHLALHAPKKLTRHQDGA